jgi:hypothetical protein
MNDLSSPCPLWEQFVADTVNSPDDARPLQLYLSTVLMSGHTRKRKEADNATHYCFSEQKT